MNKQTWPLVLFSLLPWVLLLIGHGGEAERIINRDDLPPTPDSPPVWVFQTVDAPTSYWNMGARSLALNAQDRPCIAYGGKDLYYARYDGITWTIETVTSAGRVGEHASLALDIADRPHISYYDATNEDLNYAWHDGARWFTETVDFTESVGLFTSLALDTAGYPHISYYDATNQDLKYAYYNSLGWQIETIDSPGAVGRYSSLALDSAGNPHISYYDATSSDLKYAYSDGPAWYIETVDAGGGVGKHTSLALDAIDRPHITYRDESRTDQKYAFYDGSVWHVEQFDRGRASGSLALDTFDLPHVSYYDKSRILRYAFYDGTIWHAQTVDADGDAGQYNSIALDMAGRPHISYSADDRLKYAYLCAAITETKVSGPAVLLAGETGLYTTTYTPFTATTPAIVWSNGHVGPTAAYSWTLPGRYTLTVTATNGCSAVSATFPVDVLCQEIERVTVDGPNFLLLDETALYTATCLPPTATEPISLSWDSGASGPTAAYSWTLPGRYTLTVTATNGCSAVSATFPVDVLCQEIEGVTVDGPNSLLLDETALYTATCLPPTATEPISLSWDSGASGPTAAYSWTAAGTYTITVTATNRCGCAVEHLAVKVIPRVYHIYLPVIDNPRFTPLDLTGRAD